MTRVSNEQRRIDLINAAVEVIAERGVSGATTRMIADRAESPLTMIHYCFGAKEDLYFAIFEHLATSQFDEVLHILPGVGLGRAAASLTRQVGAWVYDTTAYARAQTELFVWATRQDVDKARRGYAFTVDVFAAKLREGLRPEDDDHLVDVIARIIASYGDGLVLHDLAYSDKAIHQTCVDAMAESLEHLADAHRALPVTTS
ncbi:TetR/AcrR family transcriptional regulator [Rhodococcus wratislaviensis]|uniref:TetR/AcrR family transcriptional regulator n=1 Tax=Rhodococcus wratislaviensis TaxID=44752 RepID=UPI00351518C4